MNLDMVEKKIIRETRNELPLIAKDSGISVSDNVISEIKNHVVSIVEGEDEDEGKDVRSFMDKNGVRFDLINHSINKLFYNTLE
jgi:hypothetical protein